MLLFTQYDHTPSTREATERHVASAALSSNNASLFPGLPAVTGMIKMEIVFISYVLFLH